MSDKIKVFESVLNEFEDESMRLYCEDMIEQTPDYIFTIPSSTSYKYHNATQCQPGGQLYHILMVASNMNYLLGLEYIRDKFPKPKQRDCMRIAAILHDNIKCGLDGSQFTVHEHPMLCRDWIVNTVVEHDIDERLKKYIGSLVSSHSGQWVESKRSSMVLPKPMTDDQFFVHMCDYFGSRSNIDMIYTDEQKDAIASMQEPVDPSTLIFPFGKWKDTPLLDVPLNYLEWAYENMNALREPLKSAIGELIKK